MPPNKSVIDRRSSGALRVRDGRGRLGIDVHVRADRVRLAATAIRPERATFTGSYLLFGG
jgi:hypothetical protein